MRCRAADERAAATAVTYRRPCVADGECPLDSAARGSMPGRPASRYLCRCGSARARAERPASRGGAHGAPAAHAQVRHASPMPTRRRRVPPLPRACEVRHAPSLADYNCDSAAPFGRAFGRLDHVLVKARLEHARNHRGLPRFVRSPPDFAREVIDASARARDFFDCVCVSSARAGSATYSRLTSQRAARTDSSRAHRRPATIDEPRRPPNTQRRAAPLVAPSHGEPRATRPPWRRRPPAQPNAGTAGANQF